LGPIPNPQIIDEINLLIKNFIKLKIF